MSATTDVLPRLLSLRVVARQLAMPGRDVLALLEARGVRPIRLGKRVRIAEADVLAMLADGAVPTSREIQDRSLYVRVEAVRRLRGDAAAEAFQRRIERRRPRAVEATA